MRGNQQLKKRIIEDDQFPRLRAIGYGSKLDIQTVFDNLPPDDTRGLVVLCAGHGYDSHLLLQKLSLEEDLETI